MYNFHSILKQLMKALTSSFFKGVISFSWFVDLFTRVVFFWQKYKIIYIYPMPETTIGESSSPNSKCISAWTSLDALKLKAVFDVILATTEGEEDSPSFRWCASSEVAARIDALSGSDCVFCHSNSRNLSERTGLNQFRFRTNPVFVSIYSLISIKPRKKRLRLAMARTLPLCPLSDVLIFLFSVVRILTNTPPWAGWLSSSSRSRRELSSWKHASRRALVNMSARLSPVAHNNLWLIYQLPSHECSEYPLHTK